MALSKDTVLRAWKDESFRNSLSPEDRDSLPERPTGEDGAALTDEQLEAAAGGTTPGCAAVTAFAASVILEDRLDE